jgi:hypothetical protein
MPKMPKLEYSTNDPIWTTLSLGYEVVLNGDLFNPGRASRQNNPRIFTLSLT